MLKNILIGVGVFAVAKSLFFAASDALTDRIQLSSISNLNIVFANALKLRLTFNLVISNQLEFDLPGTSFVGSLKLGTTSLSAVDIQNINLTAGQTNEQFVTAEIPLLRLADNVAAIIETPTLALAGLTLTGNLLANGVSIPVSKRLI